MTTYYAAENPFAARTSNAFAGTAPRPARRSERPKLLWTDSAAWADVCIALDTIDSPGLAVFVGGLQWFGVRWGWWAVPGGLADAGFAGQVLCWQWHRPVAGLFCLPVYLDRNRIEREAAILAEFLADRRRVGPERPIHLLGCSAGGYVALRALELLPTGVRVDSVALLSAAFDPRHDLSPALEHVAGVLVNTNSRLDWVVLGLGNCLIGTCEGRHTPAAGMVGLKRPRGDGRSGELPYPAKKVRQIRWRPRMLLTGRLGGHVTATPRTFVARYVAPAMGITSSASGLGIDRPNK